MEVDGVRSALRKFVRQRLNAKRPKGSGLLEIRTPYTRASLKLPLPCTDGPGKTCELLSNLQAVNELLYLTAAEVVEIAPRKVAIRFFEGFPHEGYTRDEMLLQYVSHFVHDMVGAHRCVVCVEITFSPRGSRACNAVLFSSLEWNTWLTCLCITNCRLGVDATSQAFNVIQRLLKLHLLELSLCQVEFVLDEPTSLLGLTVGLMETTKLNTLKIFGILINPQQPSAQIFLEKALDALTRMTTLKSLVLDSTFSSYTHGTKFLRMLANPSAPAIVTVVCILYPENSQTAGLVFNALLENRTVTMLRLEEFTLRWLDAISLSTLLQNNRTILDINCGQCQWDKRELELDFRQVRWHANHLIHGLAATKSLQQIAVDLDFNEWELPRLLFAANSCATLLGLHFPFLRIESILLWTIRRYPLEMIRKVTFGKAGPKMSFQMAWIIQNWIETNGEHAELQNIFAQLSQRNPLHNIREDWLTSLTLLDMPGDDQRKVANALAAYLPVTPHLRRLKISSESASPADEIINGLAKNKTILELEIINFSLSEECADVLCRWLASSRRVHRVALSLSDDAEEGILETLATLLDSNYTLTSIKVAERFLNSQAGQQVINLVRRNYGLLQCAAHFALGYLVKRNAGAFEKVSWHPQLPKKLEQIGYLSAYQAAIRIQESQRRIRYCFWSLVGIVHEELVCNPPQPGAYTEGTREPPQLDSLRPELLDHIRSFLTIGDILDDEEYEEDEEPIEMDVCASPQRIISRRRSV
ncbi:uncharacterized protein LOC144129637 [Amblyomma americanum]